MKKIKDTPNGQSIFENPEKKVANWVLFKIIKILFISINNVGDA